MKWLTIILALTAAVPASAQGLMAAIVAQDADEVTIAVTWTAVQASNGEMVTSYELDARSSSLRSAVEDFTSPDGGDRAGVYSETLTGTQATFTVARPDCCSPLFVGVRIRGHHQGQQGPWTNPAYPVVQILTAPLTIPQVPIDVVDTLPATGPGPDPDDGLASVVEFQDGGAVALGSLTATLPEGWGPNADALWLRVEAPPENINNGRYQFAEEGAVSQVCAYAVGCDCPPSNGNDTCACLTGSPGFYEAISWRLQGTRLGLEHPRSYWPPIYADETATDTIAHHWEYAGMCRQVRLVG